MKPGSGAQRPARREDRLILGLGAEPLTRTAPCDMHQSAWVTSGGESGLPEEGFAFRRTAGLAVSISLGPADLL